MEQFDEDDDDDDLDPLYTAAVFSENHSVDTVPNLRKKHLSTAAELEP